MHSRLHLDRLAVILSLLLFPAIFLHAGTDAEDQLKCATLLAFLQNTHWAEHPAEDSSITVGVVGRAGFLRWLRTAVDGKSVDGHRLRIVLLTAPADPACCQMVYFATDKAAEIHPMLQAFSNTHVLTMGESDAFLEAGGAVNLFLVDGHMAFEVSLGALGHAGIEISSKLLRFGQIRDLEKRRPGQ